MSKNKTINYIILGLILINLILTGIMIFTSTDFCITELSCDIVQNSKYSKILGFSLSKIGFSSFIILLVVFSWTLYKPSRLSKNLSDIIITLGFVASLYFIFLQLFIIGAICSECMIVDSIMILIFILNLFKKSSYQ